MASHIPMGPLKSFSAQVRPPSGKDHESSSLSLPKTEETFVATFGFLLALPTGALEGAILENPNFNVRR